MVPAVFASIRVAAFFLPVAALQASLANAEPPTRIAVRDFVGNPTISRPTLSPDGKTYAYIHSQGDQQFIVSRAVNGTGPPVGLAKIDDPETRLGWIAWANPQRLLISAQGRNPNSIHVRSRITRLFGVNADGQNFVWLGRRWPLFGQLQLPVAYQDRIISWTPDDDDTVLIEYWPPNESAPSVMRMDVNTGVLRQIQGDMSGIRGWRADVSGHIRAGEAHTAANLYQLFARVQPQDKLEKVIEHPAFGDGGPVLAGLHEDATKIYVMAPHEGRQAVFEFDLPSKRLGNLVFSHPTVDADGLKYDPGAEQRVIGVRYTVDRPAIHFFDSGMSREYRGLDQALQGEFGAPVFHEPVSVSKNGEQQILEVSSETQPPVYYLYDRTKRQIERILEQYPGLKPQYLAPVKRYTYQARDGLDIPAYVTLPPGVEPRNLPTIVNVHGGPWARDSIRWDPELQLLANRGFAVLQVNFRGSSGLGRKHLEAGYREWGQRIQDDITDGVKWLIAQGIADPDRIGIMGGSYGGYATLVGLAKTPELYRAGAAYASVTDIEFLLSDDKWYNWGYEWHETLIGGGRGDVERLRQSSPLRHVKNIRAPVLLGHGADDQRVHVRQSQRMAKALREAGKEYEYLEFPDEIHGFLLEANRMKWYEAVVTFFEKNLAPTTSAISIQRET